MGLYTFFSPGQTAIITAIIGLVLGSILLHRSSILRYLKERFSTRFTTTPTQSDATILDQLLNDMKLIKQMSRAHGGPPRHIDQYGDVIAMLRSADPEIEIIRKAVREPPPLKCKPQLLRLISQRRHDVNFALQNHQWIDNELELVESQVEMFADPQKRQQVITLFWKAIVLDIVLNCETLGELRLGMLEQWLAVTGIQTTCLDSSLR